MMPTNPYEKHPEILADIKRIQERRKRRMERTPGRVKPVNEIPMKQLLDEGNCAKDYYDPTKTPPYKPVETPVHDPVKLKLKRIDAVPYRPDWRDVTIALLIVYAGFLTAVVLL